MTFQGNTLVGAQAHNLGSLRWHVRIVYLALLLFASSVLKENLANATCRHGLAMGYLGVLALQINDLQWVELHDFLRYHELSLHYTLCALSILNMPAPRVIQTRLAQGLPTLTLWIVLVTCSFVSSVRKQLFLQLWL